MQNNKQHTDFIRRLKQRAKQGADWINILKNAADQVDNIVNTFKKFEMSTVEDAIKAQVQEVINLTNKTIAMSSATLDAADSNQKYLIGLNRRLGTDRKMAEILKTQLARANEFEKRNLSLNKTFGITTSQSAKLSQALAVQAKRYEISHKEAIKLASSINSVVTSINLQTLAMDEANYSSGEANRIKSFKQRYAGLQLVQKMLVTNMGLEAKAAEEFSYYSTNRSNNAKDQLLLTKELASEVDKQLGTQNSFKIITEEIGNSAASTQLQFGRMGGSLELAAIKGRNLGLSLDQVAKIGNDMLNIENSIGKELEYQLLSGRRLIGAEGARADLKGKSLTNAFREAALVGDANKQADALNAILEQEGDTLTNNVLARKQMADLLGMEENQLARALQKKKLLESMGADEKLFELGGKEFNAAVQKLRSTGQATDAQIKQAMRLKDTRSTEEKMDEQLEIAEDTKIATFLQTEQSQRIANNSAQSVLLMKQLVEAQGKIKPAMEAELQALGSAQMAIDAFDAVQSVITGAKNLKMEEAEDFLAINGKLVKYRKDDLVIGGTFGGRRQQVINQVTQNASGGSDGGGGMNAEQFAQAIVSAMKSAKFNVAVDDVAAMFVNT